MADGEITLKLDDGLARRLAIGAAAVRMTPEGFAEHLLEQQLFNYDDYAWREDPRTAVEPAFDATQPGIPLKEAMATLRSELKVRMGAEDRPD